MFQALREVLRGGVFLLAIACGSTEETPNQPRVEAPAPEPGVAPDEGETVRFETADGVHLVGTSWRGEGDVAVVLLHQLSGDRREWAPVREALEPLGVTVLAIDLRGHGDSTGGPEGPIQWRAFDNAAWRGVVEDAKAAMRFLDAQVAPSRFVLVGSSIGSSAALLAAAEEPRVAGVVALSPGSSYRGLETGPAAESLRGRALLAIAAEGEAPAADTARSLAESSGGEAEIVSGSAHGLRMVADAPTIPARVARFVEALEETR